MIVIAAGSNLPAPGLASARATCEAALAALAQEGLRWSARSSWYESPPQPPSAQPWFINGAALLESAPPPRALLTILHRVERRFGRRRRIRNEARTLDLDLIAYHDLIMGDGGSLAGRARPAGGESLAGSGLCLPHPRMAERAFVLAPLREIAPGWIHPASRLTVETMLAALPAGTVVRRLV